MVHVNMCENKSECGVYGRVQVTMHVYMREHKSVCMDVRVQVNVCARE